MKKLKFIAFIAIFIFNMVCFQSIAKIYVFEYDKLTLFGYTKYLETPEYINDCYLIINTSEKSSTLENYMFHSKQLVSNFITDYDYINSWDDSIRYGELILPWNIRNATFMVYDKNNLKCLEITISNDCVSSFFMWQNNNIILKIIGEISMIPEGQEGIYCFSKGLYTKYNFKNDLYFLEKQKQFDEFYKTTATFYPTGELYSYTSTSFELDYEFGEIDGEIPYAIVSHVEKYFNKDGTIIYSVIE